MYLFGVIEGLSSDVNDPYHYPVIRVLVGLFSERKKKKGGGGRLERLTPSSVDS